MITQGRFRPVFEASPSRVVAILEVFRAPSFVGQVPCGKNCAGNLLDQLSGCFGAFQILAASDVARTNENKRLLRRALFHSPDLAVLGMAA